MLGIWISVKDLERGLTRLGNGPGKCFQRWMGRVTARAGRGDEAGRGVFCGVAIMVGFTHPTARYFVEITKGKGHLTRMQAVLKAYVEAHR